jgi:ABC-2 type transport system permease protein
MNIFLRELKANLKALVIFSVIVVLISTVGFAKFSVYAENPELLSVIEKLPASLLDAFNLRSFNLTTLSGFYGVMFTYYALIVGLAAAIWGNEVIVKEERDKTAEFSLTLPISRRRAVTAKLLAMTVDLAALILVIYLTLFFLAQSYQPDRAFWDFLVLSLGGLALLAAIFLAVGALLGCAMDSYKKSGAAAIAVTLGTYFLSVFSGLHEKLAFLAYFSPFRYADAWTMWQKGRIESVYLWISACVILASLAAAYWLYERRDLLL